NHHKVRIQDDACIAAVKLSERYISERFLPDKAIDLMDEAAAKLRMERDSVPEELDEIIRKRAQLEIERESIRREAPLSSPEGDTNDHSSKIQQLEKQIAELREQETQMRAQWETEKTLSDKYQQVKEEIEQLKFEAERAEREGNYGRVAEIRYGLLKQKNEELNNIMAQQKASRPLLGGQGGSGGLEGAVTADDIAEIVSRWTGIPVTRMLQSEKEKLLHLEDELHRRVVGQDEAIQAVSDAVRRSRAGLQDPKRPIASFIFLGTTGVGKTELAKALAEYLFNDETMMTRIDMSEYQEKHTVSRLVGAPPGYVGYDEGGQLTEAVRRKPYSVLLFDEIEKAHPDVFNILLQVLDDGRLTDNKGRTANFKNTLIIMTSNATREQLSVLMRPEFLNRIDEIITFQPLTREQISAIVTLQMEKVRDMLAPQGFDLQWTPQAIDYLATVGYDPQFGARPVKRAIQQYVLNELSKRLLAEEVSCEKPVIIDEFGDGLVFRN
ncbi:MAG: AAA family ATPase, partial [Prevotella sp.]|nr:AAA family ATPase [Prevotella sp.]